MFPPGRARSLYQPIHKWISRRSSHDWDGPCHCSCGPYDNCALSHNYIDVLIYERHSELRKPRDIAVAPFRHKDEIAPLHVPTLRQCAHEGIEFAFGRRGGTQKADAPHSVRLLRTRPKRQRCCTA